MLCTLTVVSETPWLETLRKKPLHTRWAEFLPDDVPSGPQGRELAHADMSPHNMLVTGTGDLLLLDRALACPAPAYSAADPATVTMFARTVHAAWEHWERTRPMPHRAALTSAALAWATHRAKGRQTGAHVVSS
ncbi:hypothetical protein [Streptomyces sp. NPDC001978]|uniref:hypothetical protein n=1 Tax=Streptomyces sp. NPDC001978 TaxID=3364627 RepID=UPI003687522B